MLCPKCGFISFDHLSICGKCHNDLSAVGATLRGTTGAVTCRLFLGAILKETPDAPADQSGSPAPSTSMAIHFETEEAVAEVEEMTAITLDDSGLEEAAPVSVADEPPALEFDLDEIPHLDTSGLDSFLTAEEGPAKETALPTAEAEITLLEFESNADDSQHEGSLAKEAAALAAGTLEIDTSSLTLDSLEVEEPSQPASEAEPAEGEQTAALTIDLNEIDLSDLVHDEQSGTAPAQAGTGAEGGGQDFEDTMDLSLFAGEMSEPPTDSGLPDGRADGLEPIDLTLVDEALVELTVDPDRKEQQALQGEGQTEILELSMEDSSK